MPNQKQTSQSQTETNSSTSSIDLTQLTLQELMDLKDRVNAELASVQLRRMSDYDVVIDYTIDAHTKTDTIQKTEGTITLPYVLHESLLTSARDKLRDMMRMQVLEPLYTSLEVTIQNRYPQAKNLAAIEQQTGSIEEPL